MENALTQNGAFPDVSLPVEQPYLIEAPVSSELADFVGLTRQIIDRYPEILQKIEADQVQHGLAKKQIRIADKRFRECLAQDLPFEIGENLAPPATLDQGRPRMPALLVVVFFFLRGWFGGAKGDRFRIFVSESQTLRQLYDELQVKAPGLSTINDNLNTLSPETCDLCLRCQLAFACEKELDDFDRTRADSTAVHGNSIYPTESVLIRNFLLRALAGFARLAKMAFQDFTGRVKFKEAAAIAKEVYTFSQIIGMVSGKAGAAEKRQANYQKIYSRVPRIIKRVGPLVDQAREKLGESNLLPSKHRQTSEVLEKIDSDLASAAKIAEYSKRRVLDGETIAIEEKILSVCDKDATIIKKGERDLVFGYRPQLAFSGKGLVTAMLVPEGNAADSGQLEGLLDQVEKNTGVIASVVTVDDGYLNQRVRDRYLERASEKGITATFSIGGSKGKRSLGEDLFYSDEYQEARDDRSAAESCISTLKGCYGYGEVKRRGIESVRQEQMSKVLAYNTRKLVALVRAKEEPQNQIVSLKTERVAADDRQKAAA